MKYPKNLYNFILSRKKLSIIVLIAIVGIGYFVISSNKKTVIPLYATVKKQDLKQEVSASGVLTGKDSANLRFKTSGKLAYILVKAGDTVQKGQVIASLDTQELAIELRQAENTLRDKRAIVDKVKDDLNNTKNETYAQRQTRTTAEVAQDNAYDSKLAAERAFQDAVITSPIDGTVTKADVLPGQIVSSTDTIAQIVDFSEIVFETDVDEADISKITLDQKAEVTLNAYGEKVFDGIVTQVVAQTKTTSNGATVVTVKISLPDDSIQHIAGLNGQVNIIQEEKKNVLAVPLEAVVNNMVLVKTNTKPIKKSVTTGFKSDSDVEIVSGLKEGESVVTNPNEVGITQRSNNFLLRFFIRR